MKATNVLLLIALLALALAAGCPAQDTGEGDKVTATPGETTPESGGGTDSSAPPAGN